MIQALFAQEKTTGSCIQIALLNVINLAETLPCRGKP